MHQNKAQTVKEFVERIDSSKKKNPKDLSSDQDLTIALMNLISIEEHLVFSGAKTGKTSFYDMVKDIREMRKNLMMKVIPSYEGEVWCISKHLLATSMRLMEVGTKQQSMGRDEEAYGLFNQAYDLYCLFWGLNMGLVDTSGLKWEEDNEQELMNKAQELQKALPIVTNKVEGTQTNGAAEPEQNALADKSVKDISAYENAQTNGSLDSHSLFSKFKAIVKKAVDCCIE